MAHSGALLLGVLLATMYYYSSTAGVMHLVGAITNSAGSITVDATTGLPASVPFKVVIDPGLATEEIVKVTGVAGSTLTVTRGWDGSSALAHDNGATVRHMVTAEDFRLSRDHENATTGVHGLTGALLGTTDVQGAITGKTFQATSTETPLAVQQAGSSTADLTKWSTTAGSLRARLSTLGFYLRSASNDIIELLTSDGESASGFLARIRPTQTTSDAIRVDMPASSTGKAITLALNSVEKARVDASGAAVVQSLSSVGAVSGTTGTFTGAVSGTTGTFSGAVSSAGLTSTAGVSGTTGTFSGALSSASASISGAASANSVTTSGLTVNGTATMTARIVAPGLVFTGNEGTWKGTGASANQPLDLRFFTVVGMTSGAGGLAFNWPGGAFPNGIATCVVALGDNAGNTINPILNNSSLTGWNGIVRDAAGAGLASTTVRANGFVLGW